MALATKVQLADDIVKEYLLRRGFASTFDAFESDQASDPLEQNGIAITSNLH